MPSNNKKVLLAEATPPSYLVTDTGQRAWFAQQTKLINMSVEMFDFILENKPLAVELYTRFPSADPADVSDCMWRLLDELFIEIRADNRLAVIGEE